MSTGKRSARTIRPAVRSIKTEGLSNFAVMELHQTRPHWAIFKMQPGRLKHVGTKLFPSVGLREDGVPKRTRAITAFFRIANLENQLHSNRVPEIVGTRFNPARISYHDQHAFLP